MGSRDSTTGADVMAATVKLAMAGTVASAVVSASGLASTPVLRLDVTDAAAASSGVVMATVMTTEPAAMVMSTEAGSTPASAAKTLIISCCVLVS